MGKRGLLIVLVFLACGIGFWWVGSGGRSHDPVSGAPSRAARESAQPAALLAEPVAPPSAAAGEQRSAADERVAVEVSEDVAAEAGAPLDATVVVRIVRSDTGEPLPGERVALLPENNVTTIRYAKGAVGALGESVPADAQGRCTFRIPPGERGRAVPQAVRRDESAAVAVGPLAAGETREVTVALEVFWHWIRVEDASSGAPLAGARLSRGPKEASTDLGGLAALWWLPAKLDQVWIEADGYGPALVGVQPGHETPATALVVRLSRASGLRGRVLARNDVPVDGALVEVIAHGIHLGRNDPEGMLEMLADGFAFLEFEDRRWSVTAGADGAFAFTGLPPAIPLSVVVTKAGFPRLEVGEPLRPLEVGVGEPLRLEPGEQRTVDFHLGGGALVRGSVRDAAGAPVPRCVLWLQAGPDLKPFSQEDGRPERNLSSDEQGRFEILGVPPGEWEVGPAPRSGYLPTPVPLRVLSDLATVEIVVEARTGLFVAGIVVGPDGQPVSNVNVSSDHGPSAESGADGTFRIGPFMPGTVELVVLTLFSGFGSPDPLEVQAGDEGIVLRVEAGGTLAGTVTGLPAGPDSGVVSLREPLAGALEVVRSSSLSQNGGFVFESLRPGTYSVSARSSDGAAGWVGGIEVAAGAKVDGVVINLAPGGRLALRFPVAGDKQAYRVRAGACVFLADSVGPEELLTPHLPAGAVTVELLAGKAFISARDVTVRAGEILPVDLSKEP